MENLIAPFDAYKGDKPYIFVSYAHRNSKVVFRHITRLRDEGFRIWYDEGIDPGTDWSDEIAKALSNATSFLVFISPEMVDSHNVKKEIVFALSKKKQMIAVHIAETTLPAGLEMQLSNIQALLENRFNDKEKFYERLFAALPVVTRGNRASGTDNHRPPDDSPKGFWNLFKRNKPKDSELPQEDSGIAIEKTKPDVKPAEVPDEKPAPPPVEKETQKPLYPAEQNNNPEKKTTTKFAPKPILLNELEVTHSPLNEKDFFHSGTAALNGRMLQLGEWLYFQGKDFKLYKIKVNGEGLARVSKGSGHSISMYNGYIYFVDSARNNRIFRTNGDECKMFVDIPVGYSYTLTPQGFAYSQPRYAGNPLMASIPEKYILVDYEGNIVNEEALFAPNLCSDENYVFFTKEEEGASLLYRADFDGTNIRKVCDENIYRIIGFNKEFIYFLNKDDDNKLYRVYADGSQLTNLNFSEGFYETAIIDDSLYYNNMYGGIIKRYVFEKEEDELLLKIAGKVTNFFEVIGNWMFIRIEPEQQNEYYLCRMNLSNGVFETIAKLTNT